MKALFYKIAAWVLLFFGLVTIFAGGSVILDLFGMREKEGNYVLFVVWANFICGFLYVAASYGFFKRKTWTSFILSAATWILIIAFGGLLIHIQAGGIYENKTIVAMIFRTSLTIVLLGIARKMNRKISQFKVQSS